MFFVTFPYGVLGQVWYLIASIPDLCLLPYLIYSFKENEHVIIVLSVAMASLQANDTKSATASKHLRLIDNMSWPFFEQAAMFYIEKLYR